MTDISAKRESLVTSWEQGVAAAASSTASSYSTGYHSQLSGQPPPPHLPSPYSSFSQPISYSHAQPQGSLLILLCFSTVKCHFEEIQLPF